MTTDFVVGAALTIMLAIWADLKTDIREIRAAVGLAPSRARR